MQCTKLNQALGTQSLQMEILLVEDHRLVADAMQIMLKQSNPSSNVTASYSTQHALSILDAGKKFDLVLTDLLMPGIDGIGLLISIKNRDLALPVVIITGSDVDAHVNSAIENGASGFIVKTLPASELIAGLQIVADGGTLFPERFGKTSQSSLRSDNTGKVTPDLPELQLGRKQQNVLQLMADGHSNKQISQIVGVKEATVKYHTSQLFKQLGVKNRTSCVREAQRRGLIRKFNDLSG
ncbi:MAG: two-component system competent response regulator ComA [Granulosicoccus sp.]|jgi:two-component system competent response regulator ComA